MSSIDIRNFVDINISTSRVSSISSIRERVVLFTNETALTSDVKIFKNLKEVEEAYGDAYEDKVSYKYAKVYFESGGNELKAIYSETLSEATLLPLVNNLPDEEIVIAIAASNGESAATSLKLAESYNNQSNVNGFGIYGVNQKIFLGAVDITQFLNNTSNYAKADVDNFALKVGDLQKQIGCEMTIAAYLSKIDVYGINTIQDYAYTKEILDVSGYPDDLNTVVQSVLTNNANITVEIANSVRNIGGNLTNSEDLVNKFTLIVLHQTLSQRVFNTLTQKIKGSAGITALYSTISQELNKYITSGYLTTDKVWTKEDLTLKYNGRTYTLITQGTALIKGYNITILPLSSLTDEDKIKHKAPLIYVILADGYSIRKVVINGEVI